MNDKVGDYRLKRALSQNSIHGNIGSVLLVPNNFTLFDIVSIPFNILIPQCCRKGDYSTSVSVLRSRKKYVLILGKRSGYNGREIWN